MSTNIIRQTTFERNASISMSNQKIVFELNRNGSFSGLYLVKIDGTPLSRLTNKQFSYRRSSSIQIVRSNSLMQTFKIWRLKRV